MACFLVSLPIMPNDFNKMPANARVWVYASPDKLTTLQEQSILEKTNSFLQSWESHGVKLQSACAVLHGYFLVVMVDENHHEASGCGIDKLVHFVNGLQQELHVNLFNRLGVYLLQNNNEVMSCTKQKALELLRNGTLGTETLCFDNSVSNKDDFDERWQIPVTQSWFYPKAEIAV